MNAVAASGWSVFLFSASASAWYSFSEEAHDGSFELNFPELKIWF
jgi:hypothetical protein